MAGQDQADDKQPPHGNRKPVPVPPSGKAERPEGVAFDVEEGAELPGVPVGDQTPKNPDASHTEEVVTERGEGIGLAVPTRPEEAGGTTAGEEAADR